MTKYSELESMYCTFPGLKGRERNCSVPLRAVRGTVWPATRHYLIYC